MEIDKIPVNFFCLKKQLKEHKKIKKDLIKKILAESEKAMRRYTAKLKQENKKYAK